MTKYEAGYRMGAKMLTKKAGYGDVLQSIRGAAGLEPSRLRKILGAVGGGAVGGNLGGALGRRGGGALAKRFGGGRLIELAGELLGSLAGSGAGSVRGAMKGMDLARILHKHNLSTPKKLLAGGLDFAEAHPLATAAAGAGGLGLAGYGGLKALSDED